MEWFGTDPEKEEMITEELQDKDKDYLEFTLFKENYKVERGSGTDTLDIRVKKNVAEMTFRNMSSVLVVIGKVELVEDIVSKMRESREGTDFIEYLTTEDMQLDENSWYEIKDSHIEVEMYKDGRHRLSVIVEEKPTNVGETRDLLIEKLNEYFLLDIKLNENPQ